MQARCHVRLGTMRITISLVERLGRQARSRAAAHGQSVSAFIAAILADALKRETPTTPPRCRLITVGGNGVGQRIDLDRTREVEVADDEARALGMSLGRPRASQRPPVPPPGRARTLQGKKPVVGWGRRKASGSQAPFIHWCVCSNTSLGPSRPPFTSEVPARRSTPQDQNPQPATSGRTPPPPSLGSASS